MIFKLEIVLEILLGLHRNKRGLKWLSFGLCINRMELFLDKTFCLVKMLLDSIWEAKNRHTQSWLGEKRECVKICVSRV